MTSSNLTVNSSFNLLLYSPIFEGGWSNFTKHVSAELEPCPSQLYLKWNMILTTFAYHYLSIGYYFPQWSMKCLSWIPFWIGVPTEETAFVAMFFYDGFCRLHPSAGAELEEFRLIDASADEKHMAFTIHMDRVWNCRVFWLFTQPT